MSSSFNIIESIKAKDVAIFSGQNLVDFKSKPILIFRLSYRKELNI